MWTAIDRKSTRLNSSHLVISYAVFCLKKKKITEVSNDENPVLIRLKQHVKPGLTVSEEEGPDALAPQRRLHIRNVFFFFFKLAGTPKIPPLPPPAPFFR